MSSLTCFQELARWNMIGYTSCYGKCNILYSDIPYILAIYLKRFLMCRKRRTTDLASSGLSRFFEEKLQSFARIRKYLSLLHCRQFFAEAPNLIKQFFIPKVLSTCNPQMHPKVLL